jgi:hypothetical protein
MIAEGNEQDQNREKGIDNSAYSRSIKIQGNKQHHSNDVNDRAKP